MVITTKIKSDNPNWKGGNPTKVCVVCQKKYEVSRRKREEKRRFCSHVCRGFYFSGKMNGNWKGESGKNRNHNERQRIIEGREYKTWRKKVVDRDGWKCIICESRKNLVAHHIKCYWGYQDLRFDLKNGITLCRSCHTNVHLNKVISIESSETNTLDIINLMKIESDLMGDHEKQAEMTCSL
jgi:hypothetical protein